MEKDHALYYSGRESQWTDWKNSEEDGAMTTSSYKGVFGCVEGARQILQLDEQGQLEARLILRLLSLFK